MTRSRKVIYVSGTRADFGLMRSTLQDIHASPALELGVVVTGMHLDERFGGTVGEIEAAGLPIIARVPVDLGQADGASVAKNIATMLSEFVDAFAGFAPDCVVVLGDRGEMLAAAIAGGHMSIPVMHIHGGERSGTIDEPIRHAISKLAHYHLVATDESRERLIRMGEARETVHVVGAPGLDGLEELAMHDQDALYSGLGLESTKETALLVYHPVLQEADNAGEQIEAVLAVLLADGVSVLALKPNSDAGSNAITAVLERHAALGSITLKAHLPRDQFVSMLRHADLLVGNSSSGIIEAATFGIPVVNIGSRQNLRQRNSNIIDTPAERSSIVAAIRRARELGRQSCINVYGDGRAGQRIIDTLENLELPGQLLNKANAY
jgi:GDP/UDP-N,N'-diacetylbacillosamine 2-epimerase (hydrolysing)